MLSQAQSIAKKMSSNYYFDEDDFNQLLEKLKKTSVDQQWIIKRNIQRLYNSLSMLQADKIKLGSSEESSAAKTSLDQLIASVDQRMSYLKQYGKIVDSLATIKEKQEELFDHLTLREGVKDTQSVIDQLQSHLDDLNDFEKSEHTLGEPMSSQISHMIAHTKYRMAIANKREVFLSQAQEWMLSCQVMLKKTKQPCRDQKSLFSHSVTQYKVCVDSLKALEIILSHDSLKQGQLPILNILLELKALFSNYTKRFILMNSRLEFILKQHLEKLERLFDFTSPISDKQKVFFYQAESNKKDIELIVYLLTKLSQFDPNPILSHFLFRYKRMLDDYDNQYASFLKLDSLVPDNLSSSSSMKSIHRIISSEMRWKREELFTEIAKELGISHLDVDELDDPTCNHFILLHRLFFSDLVPACSKHLSKLASLISPEQSDDQRVLLSQAPSAMFNQSLLASHEATQPTVELKSNMNQKPF